LDREVSYSCKAYALRLTELFEHLARALPSGTAVFNIDEVPNNKG
jgi:hypothetical protein